MGFKLKEQPNYPRRLWSLVGFPDDGKSTFATQMATPILPIDADHRFDQVMHLAAGDVYEFGRPSEQVLVHRIVSKLYREMPDEGDVGTIVVDSLTQIISPLVMKAVADNAAGRNKNKSAAFVEKAVAMKQLASAVTTWGTDVLWVYHLQDGRDSNANKVVTTTIPKLELARLTRSLNARLQVVRKGEKRGIFVEWSRGRDGMTLWDDSGYWAGMPEKLEAAMYDGLSDGEYKKMISFTGPDDAISWAVGQGAFADTETAQSFYEQLKNEQKPTSSSEMWALWHTAVADQSVMEPA